MPTLLDDILEIIADFRKVPDAERGQESIFAEELVEQIRGFIAKDEPTDAFFNISFSMRRF